MIVYNPVSGTARNSRQTIFDSFREAGIEYDIHETRGPLDAMKFIMAFEIEKYSALILVGGDGTFHESVNGLLKRSDKK
jgi:diacylglycerol kinase (ATP)